MRELKIGVASCGWPDSSSPLGKELQNRKTQLLARGGIYDGAGCVTEREV